MAKERKNKFCKIWPIFFYQQTISKQNHTDPPSYQILHLACEYESKLLIVPVKNKLHARKQQQNEESQQKLLSFQDVSVKTKL